MDTPSTDVIISDSVQFEKDCTLFYARKRGLKHIENDLPCQDYCLARVISNDIAIVAVADGHGGADYVLSDRGSEIACTTIADIIEKIYNNSQPWTGDAEQALVGMMKTKAFKEYFISTWRNTVLKDYEQLHPNTVIKAFSAFDKYGTTILFAVITTHHFILGQLGDGAIWLFNPGDEMGGQLFKRHTIKVDGETDSLCSGRSIFEMHIGVIPRERFTNVLLSTDGVYDRLAKPSVFANTLHKKLFSGQNITDPFNIGEIDFSQITDDDCTVALVGSTQAGSTYDIDPILAQGYTQIALERYWHKISVYSAQKDGKAYDIHIISEYCPIDGEEVSSPMTIIHPIECISLAQRNVALVYENNESTPFSFLYECGETLEKKYVDIESKDSMELYSNPFWLKIYEKVKCVDAWINSCGLSLRDDFLDQMKISDTGDILVYNYMIQASNGSPNAPLTRQFQETLGFIGKVSCGEIELPLYECFVQGQIIPQLHTKTMEPMCRVQHSPKSDQYGLQNKATQEWKVVDPGKRITMIPVNRALRLSTDHVFWIDANAADVVAGVEFEDAKVCYRITIF